MTPSLHELGAIPGEKVRVNKDLLPKDHNPREVFTVTEAPVAPHDGPVVLRSNLTDLELNITAKSNSLTEKVK